MQENRTMKRRTGIALILFLILFLAICAGADQAKHVLILPSGLRSIGYEAFSNDFLDQVIVCDGLRSIGVRAFAGSGLQKINLPDSVSFISATAFDGCDQLFVEASADSYAAQWCDDHGITHSSYQPAPVFSAVPAGGMEVTGCSGSIVNLSIPARDNSGNMVVGIAEGAFLGSQISSLSLPDTLTYIGANAFKQCVNLSGDLVIPASVTSLGTDAFSGCENLKGRVYIPTALKSAVSKAFPMEEGPSFIYYSLYGSGVQIDGCDVSYSGNAVLPDSIGEKPVVSIGYGAFKNCKGMTGELKLPDRLTQISSSAFYGCTGITGELNLPDNLTQISSYAFYGCTGLTGTITLPPFIGRVEQFAFQNCTGITGLAAVPLSCTYVGVSSFLKCPLEGEVYFPASANINSSWLGTGGQVSVLMYSTIGGTAVQIDKATLKNITDGYTVPSQIGGKPVVSIGDSAFKSSGISGSLNLPDSIFYIGRNAFYGCKAITGGLNLPPALNAVGEAAFYGCTGLTGDLVFPAEVYSIGKSAFYQCAGLSRVIFSSKITDIGDNAFHGCKGLTGHLALGDHLLHIGSHAFDACSGLEGLSLGSGLLSIGDYAFQKCTGLTGGLAFGESLMSIGNYAFYQCTGLDGVITFAGQNLEEIGESAFQECKKLTGELWLPDSLKTIGKNAFQSTAITGKLHVSAGLTTIGSSAFASLTGLTSLEGFGNELITIGEKAFYKCTNLQGNLTLPSCLDIGSYAFAECGFDGMLTLPDNLSRIQSYAFNNIPFSGGLAIPQGTRMIGGYAFHGCGFDGPLSLPDSVTYIGSYAFYNCTALTGSLTLSDSLFYLGSYSFYGCESLSGSLRLPDTLTSIPEYAFYKCSGMTGTLTLPAHVKSINRWAFYHCGFTGTLWIPASCTSVGYVAFSGCEGFTGDLWLPDHLTYIDGSAFGEIGCEGSLILPYYATSINETDGVFPGTRFSAVYMGPKLKSVTNDVGQFGFVTTFYQFAGQKPIPLYYACDRDELQYYTGIFGDLLYPWTPVPRDAEMVETTVAAPHLRLEISPDPDTMKANSQELVVTVYNDTPEEETGSFQATEAMRPVVTLSASSCGKIQLLKVTGQTVYSENMVLCNSISYGESDSFRVRFTCTEKNSSHAKHSISASASTRDGKYSAAKVSADIQFSVPAEKRLYVDYLNKLDNHGGTLYAYDSGQVLENNADFRNWKIEIAGNLQITDAVSMQNTILHVTGDLIIQKGGSLRVASGCEISVGGEVRTGDTWLGEWLGKDSTLNLERSYTMSADQFTVTGSGLLSMNGGTLTVNTLTFRSSSAAPVMRNGRMIVREKAKLSDHFRAADNHIFQLDGLGDSLTALEVEDGTQMATLVLNRDLKKIRLSKNLSDFLAVLKLVITDKSLATLEKSAEEVVKGMNQIAVKVKAWQNESLENPELWQLNFQPGSVQEQESWPAYAAEALTAWVTSVESSGNTQFDSFNALFDNILTAMTPYQHRGTGYTATVQPLAASSQGSNVAGDGTITLKIGSTQAVYTFTLTAAGRAAAQDAYLAMTSKIMYDNLSKAIEQAANDVPYIGKYVAKAATIYMSAVYENKDLRTIVSAVGASEAMEIIMQNSPTMKKYVDFLAAVCDNLSSGKAKLENAKNVLKKIQNPLDDWGKNGFYVDEEESVKRALEYLANNIFP